MIVSSHLLSLFFTEVATLGLQVLENLRCRDPFAADWRPWLPAWTVLPPPHLPSV